MQLLHLIGTPRQRGQIHGEQMRSRIASILELWEADIENETRLPAEKYLARFLAETNFPPAIERWTPSLLDEVHGLAEGAAQDFNAMLAFQCMDEDWWFRGSFHTGHCSAIGVYDKGKAPLLAQNMDIHRMTDGNQVLLHITQNNFETHVFSFAGFLGLTGLNSSPLGVCVNTLSQLDSTGDGLPVAFILRGLLERSTLEAAENFLRMATHASGQNYMIGDQTEIRDYECSAAGIRPFDAGSKKLCHTNHPLASEDFRPGEKEKTTRSFATDSHQRLNLLTSCLDEKTVVVHFIKEILKTSPVCAELKPDDDFFTCGSLVMTLSSPPLLDVAFGPPSQNEYETFGL
jgi:isopenicillin-N N-acyltransferase-like protein